ALPELTALLRDPVADVRLAALQALPRVESTPRGPRRALIDLLKDPDRRIRIAAAGTFREGDLHDEPVVRALLETLKNPDPELRAAAAASLGEARARGWTSDEKGRSIRVYPDSAAIARDPTAGATLRSSLTDPDP